MPTYIVGNFSEYEKADSIAQTDNSSLDMVFGDKADFTITKNTDEDVDCLLYTSGVAEAELEGEALTNKETKYQTDLAETGIVLPLSPLELWAAPERKAKEEELNSKYCNMDPKDYASYADLSDVELKSEEPVCCQQLYEMCIRDRDYTKYIK